MIFDYYRLSSINNVINSKIAYFTIFQDNLNKEKLFKGSKFI